MRVARPTDSLDVLTAMYADGLGLAVLGKFNDHDGYDGVMLGRPSSHYHIEFTSSRSQPAEGAASPEHLLVFYYPDREAWSHRCQRMVTAGFREVMPENPYWKAHGKTFEDVDGYRVVICNAEWPAS